MKFIRVLLEAKSQVLALRQCSLSTVLALKQNGQVDSQTPFPTFLDLSTLGTLLL